MSAKHSYLGHAELFLSDNLRLTTTTIDAVAFVMEQDRKSTRLNSSH